MRVPAAVIEERRQERDGDEEEKSHGRHPLRPAAMAQDESRYRASQGRHGEEQPGEEAAGDESEERRSHGAPRGATQGETEENGVEMPAKVEDEETRLGARVGVTWQAWQAGDEGLTLYVDARDTFKPAALDFGPEAEVDPLEMNRRWRALSPEGQARFQMYLATTRRSRRGRGRTDSEE